jgi:hypothetical protein
MTTKPMETSEFKKIQKELHKIEYQVLVREGLAKLNGSFVDSSIVDFDEKVVDVCLTYGLQEEGHFEKYSQELILDRKTLKVKEWK